MNRQYRLSKKRLRIALILAAAACFSILGAISFASETSEPEAILWYFWGDGCPLCVEAGDWLDDFETEYPDVLIKRLEVYSSEEGKNTYFKLMAERNMEARWVPAFIYADRVWEGFNSQITAEIEELAADTYNENIHLGSDNDISDKASDSAKDSVEPSGHILSFWGSVNLARYPLAIAAISIPVLIYVLVKIKKNSKQAK